jgi:hypothetical protein
MLRCVRLHVTRMVVHRTRVARHAGVLIPRRPHVIVIATRREGRRGKACDLAGHQECDRQRTRHRLRISATVTQSRGPAYCAPWRMGARPDQDIDVSSRLADSSMWRSLGDHETDVCSLSVYNAFNAAYSDPAAEEHVQRTIPQDRRTFLAKVRVGF